MREIEDAAKKLAEILLTRTTTMALIGPQWLFVVDFMVPVLLEELKGKGEEISYNRQTGSIRLGNGSRVVLISSASDREFYKLQGLTVDIAWLHGNLGYRQAQFLFSRFQAGAVDNIHYTHG